MNRNYEKLLSYVEKHRELILKTERYLWKHPEVGYKEWKTTEYLEDKFKGLGYVLTKAENIPGISGGAV